MTSVAPVEIVAASKPLPWWRRHTVSAAVLVVAAVAFFFLRPGRDARARAYAALNRPGVTLSMVGADLDAAKLQLRPGLEGQNGNLGWTFHQLQCFPELQHLETEHLLDVNLTVFSALTNLQSLTVNDCTDLEDRQFAFLSRLPKLESLSLHGLQITPKLLRHLEGAPKLKSLQLAGPKMVGPGFASIGLMPNLQTLSLTFGRRKWDEPLSLGASKTLKVLRLANGDLSKGSVAGLERLEALEELSLWNVQVDGAFFRHLASLPRLKTVKIQAGEGKFAEVAEALAALPALEVLRLVDTSARDGERWINVRGLEKLSASRSLEEVGVASSDVGDRGVRALARIPRLKRLRLHQVGITEQCFPDLLSIGGLQELSLFETGSRRVWGPAPPTFARLRDSLEKQNGTKVMFNWTPWMGW